MKPLFQASRLSRRQLSYTVLGQQIIGIRLVRAAFGFRVVSLGGLLAAPGQYHLRPRWMLGQIGAEIIDAAANRHPAIFRGRVACRINVPTASSVITVGLTRWPSLQMAKHWKRKRLMELLQDITVIIRQANQPVPILSLPSLHGQEVWLSEVNWIITSR